MTLPRHEEEELMRRWIKDGDRQAYDRLIMSQTAVITFLAYHYHFKGAELEDILQAGYMGAARAIQKFDPRRGFRFSTYAVPWIKSYMGDVAHNGTKHRAHTTSIEHVVSAGDDPLTLGDLLTTPELDPRLDERQILLGMSLDFWHRILNRRERYVIARRYFGEQIIHLAEIGRELHLSRERVRQIEKRAIVKMRKNLSSNERKLS